MSEIIVASLPPETLAEMANEAAELAQNSMQTAILRAADCGRYLLAAKAQIPHGQWRAWLGVNFDREARTATRYMEIATAFPTAESLKGVLSVRQALRLIASDKADDTIEIQPIPVSEPEGYQSLREIQEELQKSAKELQEIEDDLKQNFEIEPQERPTIRKVSAEARKVPEAQKPKTPEVAPVLVDDVETVLYYRVGESYRLADADDVAVAALELHDPMSLVRMAVASVRPSDATGAIVELEQAIQWLCQLVEEASHE